ncbi:hypothetical protein [uncultured Nocardioides sp.]|uniref:hypothetical protein n=1 Tax=uncultured Nocardioides sp. TaxID=198441 RepID=UPI002624F3AC|nr:hypothetical protein [uncultured Nocardioides sp.]
MTGPPPEPPDPPAAWLAPWFTPPTRTELVTGHHLRPLRAADVGLPGLPPGLDPEVAAAAGLARTAFVYGAFDDEERRLLAWVTLDPGAAPHDVRVGWSLAPEEVGGGLGDALSSALPDWLRRTWPWTSPLVVRR